MGAGEKKEVPPRALSLGRYASEEMSSVHLDDSPRGKSSSWPGDEDGVGTVRSCLSILGPFSNPVFGGETRKQLTTSWLLPNEVFLAWRMIMFIYSMGTSLLLARRGSLTLYPVSAEIYLAQTAAALLVLIPCFLSREVDDADISRANSSFGRVIQHNSGENDGASHCMSSGRQMLFTTATAVLQSAMGLALFWDIVFWARLSNGIKSTASVDLMLLHAYNAMPMTVELIFGRTEFRLVYFLPAMLFIGTGLGAAVQGTLYGGSTDVDWVEGMFFESEKPWRKWAYLMASLACSCLTVFALQRLRSCFARWLLVAEEEEWYPTKPAAVEKKKTQSLPPSPGLGRDASQKWTNC